MRKISSILPSANSPITELDLQAALYELVVHNRTAVDEILLYYPLSDYHTPQLQASAIITDWFFGCETQRSLQSIHKYGHVDTYSYHFTYNLSFIESYLLGTYHGSELFFVFNKNIPIVHSFTKHDKHIAELFGTYFTNFVKSHNPNTPVKLQTVNVAWPEYSFDTPDNIAINTAPSIEHNYNAHKCMLWNEINENVR